MKVALFTGGFDKPYASGFTTALASSCAFVDVIGSNDIDGPEMHGNPSIRFLSLMSSQDNASLFIRMVLVLRNYVSLCRYAWSSDADIFHVLWNGKIPYLDRTLLMLYYKALGKTVFLTAHNVNAAARDSNDTVLNRLTLKIQYHLVDHILVHTTKMKEELVGAFDVPEAHVTVIPFGINTSVPDTELTRADAKRRLGLAMNDRTILFFGAIRPYKGLEYLVDAFLDIASSEPNYRLLIAGASRKESEQYLQQIRATIESHACRDRVIQKIEFVPDEETEWYFKASDVVALPYTHVFQSGVLFLAYSFGLPVIATDVGSLGEDISEGRTGYTCKPRNSADLAAAIRKYFASDLYKSLETQREQIQDYAHQRHSWKTVSQIVCTAYHNLCAT
jgi:glycosyltransferase involved in cell wall biosynthesis